MSPHRRRDRDGSRKKSRPPAAAASNRLEDGDDGSVYSTEIPQFANFDDATNGNTSIDMSMGMIGSNKKNKTKSSSNGKSTSRIDMGMDTDMIGTSSNKKNKSTSSSNGRSSSRSGSQRRHTKKNNLEPNDTHNNTNNGQRSSSPSIGVYDPTAAVDSKWAKFEANNPDSNTTDTIDNNIHMQSSSTPNRIRRPSAGLIRTSSIGSAAKSNAHSTANSNTNGGTNTNHHRSVTPVKRNASRIKNPASSSKPRQTRTLFHCTPKVRRPRYRDTSRPYNLQCELCIQQRLQQRWCADCV